MPRLKEFEPDAALDRAMHLFWEKGYEATTMQDLVDRMGINRFSVYSTFGSKHELFLKALDRYRDAIALSGPLRVLEQGKGLKSIRKYFQETVDFFASREGWRGCLMTNSSVETAPHDLQTATKVNTHLKRLENAFYKALIYEKRSGDYRGKKNIRDIARFLTGAALGLCVMARGRPGREVLQSHVRVTLSVLG